MCHNAKFGGVIMLSTSVVMVSVIDEWHYAECHYAGCRYADCHGSKILGRVIYQKSDKEPNLLNFFV
jgi:hypothetical protein